MYFDPNHSHSFRRDYRTNVPSYYDYLAEQSEALNQVWVDMQEILDGDIVSNIESNNSDLIDLEKKELSNNRIQYTIIPKHDTQKENVLESLGTITITHNEDTTTVDVNVPEFFKQCCTDNFTTSIVDDKVKLDINFDYVQKKLVSGETTQIVYQDDKRESVEVNFDTVQEKLQAGDNITIKDNIISAADNANLVDKEGKIERGNNILVTEGLFQGVTPEAVFTTATASQLVRSGTYFINGDYTSGGQTIDTPTKERGWLEVVSAIGADCVMQTFTPWHGQNKFFRTGSYNMANVDDYDKNYSLTSVGEGELFWSDWRIIATASAIDYTTVDKYKDILNQNNKAHRNAGAAKNIAFNGVIDSTFKKRIHYYRNGGTNEIRARANTYTVELTDNPLAFTYIPKKRVMGVLRKNYDGLLQLDEYDGLTSMKISSTQLNNSTYSIPNEKSRHTQDTQMDLTHDGSNYWAALGSWVNASDTTIRIAKINKKTGQFMIESIPIPALGALADSKAHREVNYIAVDNSDTKLLWIGVSDVNYGTRSDGSTYPISVNSPKINIIKYNVETGTSELAFTIDLVGWRTNGMTVSWNDIYISSVYQGASTESAKGTITRVYTKQGVLRDTIVNRMGDRNERYDTDDTLLEGCYGGGIATYSKPYTASNDTGARETPDTGVAAGYVDYVIHWVYNTNSASQYSFTIQHPSFNDSVYNTFDTSTASDNPSMLGNLTYTEEIASDIMLNNFNNGVNITTVTFDKSSRYKLNKATSQKEYGKYEYIAGDFDSVREMYTRHNTPLMVTGGFWTPEELDHYDSQKELAQGKTGMLLFNEQNEVKYVTYDEIKDDMQQVFKYTGKKGWAMGAFGAAIVDGEFSEGFGTLDTWQGDPNVPNSRTIFIEWYSGKRQIVTVDGHTSLGTGWTHNQIKDYLNELDPTTIKVAFLMDGGGSMRLMSRNFNRGSYVDNRVLRYFIYLDCHELDPEILYHQDSELLANNVAKGVTYKMYEQSIADKSSTIEGTQYPLTY